MSPVPLAQKVVSILSPLSGMDYTLTPLAQTAKEYLAMCGDGEECLELAGHVAKDVDRSIHNIHDAVCDDRMSILLLEYHKFCSAVTTFFCIFAEINKRVAQMLYADWQKQKSLRQLANSVNEAMKGTLRLVADVNNDIWQKVGNIMHTILHKINKMVELLRDTIMMRIPVTDHDFKHLCINFDLYQKNRMNLQQSSFTSQWSNSKRCMDDNMTGLALRNRILSNKPQDNILIEKDLYGDVSSETMVIFIINNRDLLTSAIIDEYFTYRAKWQLLIHQTTVLGIIIEPMEHSNSEDLKSPLAAYILDEKILFRVIYACRTCTSTKMVYDRVIRLLMQTSIYDKEVMTREAFLATLIPYLNIHPKPTPSALYQAVYKQM